MISLESWVNIMYYVQDAHSFWDWIYFVALIVVRTMDWVPACVCVCQSISYLWSFQSSADFSSSKTWTNHIPRKPNCVRSKCTQQTHHLLSSSPTTKTWTLQLQENYTEGSGAKINKHKGKFDEELLLTINFKRVFFKINLRIFYYVS